MSLYKCDNCGHAIYNDWIRCPNCSYIINDATNEWLGHDPLLYQYTNNTETFKVLIDAELVKLHTRIDRLEKLIVR